MRRQKHNIPVLALGGLTLGVLVSCGDMAQFKDALKGKKDPTNQDSNASLTDDAAADEDERALKAANLADVMSSSATTENLPAYKQVVKDARDYTRKLLGLTSDPLKEYRAAIEAARALSSTPDEFQTNIAAAKDKFKQEIAAQKAQIDAAKAQHEEELNKIFAATQQVFLACDDHLDDMKGPRGKGHHDGDEGKDHHGKGRGEGKGKGKGHKGTHLADDPTSTATSTSTATAKKSDSAECQAATSSLKALITPQT